MTLNYANRSFRKLNFSVYAEWKQEGYFNSGENVVITEGYVCFLKSRLK